MAAGRTWPLLQRLMRESLFSDMKPFQPASHVELLPGIFAWSNEDSCDVFVIGIFTRRTTPLADVVPLLAVSEGEQRFRARLGDVVTRQQVFILR